METSIIRSCVESGLALGTRWQTTCWLTASYWNYPRNLRFRSSRSYSHMLRSYTWITLHSIYNASCYENLVRFLTDVKLLWECVERAFKMICDISSHLVEHKLRMKYNDIEKRAMCTESSASIPQAYAKDDYRAAVLLGKVLFRFAHRCFIWMESRWMKRSWLFLRL